MSRNRKGSISGTEKPVVQKAGAFKVSLCPSIWACITFSAQLKLQGVACLSLGFRA